ncbi:MAG: hypothetical protein RMJ51_04485 [Candidatus Calescibacterium sp.]|nr:hypothetical protein [Candidatus Calescibacterium sp.]MCX7971987.1 hypothetical protein [bacterium]MDW8195475.1 hypothetical protein [Candidatus Calescibacterium sp.]
MRNENINSNQNTQINTGQNSKEILNYLLSKIFNNYSINYREDQKNVYLKVHTNKNDYNFITKNKILLTSIKAIVMAYGAKINKKIHVDFIPKR